MINAKNFRRSRQSMPLRMRNKFRTTGWRSPFDSMPVVGPMMRDGMTSVENSEKERLMKRMAEWKNSGVLKQMAELGIIPDNLGVDMNDFVGNTSAIPLGKGTASLEAVRQQGDVRRQIERVRAGILNQKEREKMTLAKLYQQQKKRELKDKIIKWLATTDEIDEVPTEYKEEVHKYHLEHDSKLKSELREDAIAEARRKKKKKREKEERKKWEAEQALRMKPEGSVWDNIGMPTSSEPMQRTTASHIPTLAELDRRQLAPAARELRNKFVGEANELHDAHRDLIQKYYTAAQNLLQQYMSSGLSYSDYMKEFGKLQNKFTEEENSMVDRERSLRNSAQQLDANYSEGTEGSGWRAPRIHKLVRPLKPFNLEQTPMDIVEEQKQALDERREQYKEQETAQHGVAPTKDNIETALPKTAEPMLQTFVQRPRISIVPHPFIFPKKKFWVKGGI